MRASFDGDIQVNLLDRNHLRIKAVFCEFQLLAFAWASAVFTSIFLVIWSPAHGTHCLLAEVQP